MQQLTFHESLYVSGGYTYSPRVIKAPEPGMAAPTEVDKWAIGGGYAAGTLSGAGIGAMVAGPIGAAIGGLVGCMSGILLGSMVRPVMDLAQ